jgi:hypothetical protein
MVLLFQPTIEVNTQRACEQLVAFQTEMTETHLGNWVTTVRIAQRPRRPRPVISSKGWT